MSTPSTSEVVNVKICPSLVTGRGVPTFGGTLHPTVDRVRLNADDRFVRIAVVGDRLDRAGEFLGDRCLAIPSALRVVVPNAEEPIGSVREVVRRDARYFFAPESGLRAESKSDLLLGRLRLID